MHLQLRTDSVTARSVIALVAELVWYFSFRGALSWMFTTDAMYAQLHVSLHS